MAESNPNQASELSSGLAKQTIIKAVAFFSFHADDALSVLRMYGPANSSGLQVIRGVENGHVRLEAVTEGDLIVIQRDFCRDYDSYTKIISLSHSQKKPVIIDLDDNLFELPSDHPDRLSGYYSDSLLPTLQAVMDADLVTVASEPLRNYLLPFNQNIQVIPNYLDDALWKMSSKTNHNESGGKIIIGYMGGQTHKPDLLMVAPVLLQLMHEYPDRISFHFWGIEAPPGLEPNSQVDWYPPVFFRYDEFANAFQAQSADIMIAPLCDNLFNSCKSSIKYLEYGAIGVAGIYSRVAPFENIIENGKDGLLASNFDDWLAGLIKLIESPELRDELVLNTQQKISQHWLLSTNAGKRIKIYEDTIANYQPKDELASSVYMIEKALAQQYYEEQQRKSIKFHTMQSQLDENDINLRSLSEQLSNKNKYINELEDEILSYVTSSSWRITRPLREFMRFARRSRNA
jgi:glycosyltransferase involved in cell wall biosynthesis